MESKLSKVKFSCLKVKLEKSFSFQKSKIFSLTLLAKSYAKP